MIADKIHTLFVAIIQHMTFITEFVSKMACVLDLSIVHVKRCCLALANPYLTTTSFYCSIART